MISAQDKHPMIIQRAIKRTATSILGKGRVHRKGKYNMLPIGNDYHNLQ